MTDTPPGASLLPEPAVLDARKTEASAWFRSLRDRICAAFETLEDEADRPVRPAGRAARADSSASPGAAPTIAARRAAAAR